MCSVKKSAGFLQSIGRLAGPASLVLVAIAAAAPLPDIFELEGDVVDGPAAPPDWTALFEVDQPPHGNVVGPVGMLPTGALDAAFLRDPLAIAGLDRIDCTVFAAGNKNGDAIGSWEFKAGSSPPKDDLSNVMAFLREDAEGGIELYLALERYAENGDSHIDFEINQSEIGLVVDSPDTDCPGDGHFVGTRLLNDLLVAVDFERGGGVSLVRVFRYVNATDLQLLVEQKVNTLGLFCNTATSVGGLLIPAGAVCVVSNAEAIDGGPWANFNRSNSRGPVETLPRNAFTELGLRLSDLPGGLARDRCIHSINVKSRSSQSITSELKDFALITFDTCSDLGGRKLEAADESTCDTLTGPIAGWEVRLRDAQGGLVSVDGDGNALENPTCTDAQGAYRFANLADGHAYAICEVIPDRRTGPDAENFDWVTCRPDDVTGQAGIVVSDATCSTVATGREFCFQPRTLRGDVTGIDFHNYRDPVVCHFAAQAFCDINGDGARETPSDTGLDEICLCITRLVNGEPDAQTTVCGATVGGIFSAPLVTGFTYRVEEDLAGTACGSSDQSTAWVNTTGSVDVYLHPDQSSACGAAIGNASLPAITCPADIVYECDAVGDGGEATAENDCGSVALDVTTDKTPGACPQESTITRTFTATTQAQLTDDCEQTINIVDTTPPELTCPPDLTAECGVTTDYGEPTVRDNCANETIVTVSVTETPGDCTVSVAGISPPPKLTVSREFTAVDSGSVIAAAQTCGNISTCTQIIQVVDTAPPQINCPPDLVFECDQIGDFGEATATDICDVVTIDEPIVVETPGECPEERTITRTFTARDACGQTDSCTQTIQIVDTTTPVVTCPPDITVECGQTSDYGEPTIEDNCDPNPIVTVEVFEIPGDCTPDGASGAAAGISPPPKLTLVREFTVTDGQGDVSIAAGQICGNVTVCTQIVQIIDTLPPVVTSCPTDRTATCGETLNFTIPSTDTCEGGLTIDCAFTDDATPDRFTAVHLADGSFDVTVSGTTTVFVDCTAIDECANASSACMFAVSATCNQACSPGFWRNNLPPWCSTPFNPVDNFCAKGTATGFLGAFELASCPLAPPDSAIALNGNLTLLEAVGSAGGSNQTLFHGSAALLSAYAVSFPATPDAVRSVMHDACAGSMDFDGKAMSWSRAFDIFKAWNSVEAEGGCPIAATATLRTGAEKPKRTR